MMMVTRNFRSRSGGFTLVELLLAVTLLAGLMAAAIFGFSSLQRSAQLNEGVERVETAMRFARAHAANTGRKVQVVVTAAEAVSGSASGGSKENSEATRAGESTPSLSILWEADPTRAPGVFEPIPSLSAEVADVSELVQIRSVDRGSKGTESPITSTEGDGGEAGTTAFGNREIPNTAGQELDSATDLGAASSTRAAGANNPGETTITFYPDGSCDGGTIVLASRDSDDAREVAVHLESVTGTTRRQWKASSSIAGTTENNDSTSPGKGSSSSLAADTSRTLPSRSSVSEPSRSTVTARGRR